MQEKGLRLQKSTNLNLEIFAEVSYRDPLSLFEKSLSRAINTVGGRMVEWWIQRHDTVVLSIMEAEYIVNYEGAKDKACLQQLFQALSLPTNTLILFIDSEVLMKLLKVWKFQRCI